jgi:hypothetical protein
VTTIKVIPNSGFTENVTLALVGGAPAGTLPFFNPITLVPATYSSGSTFKVQIPDNTPIGVRNLTIRGTASGGGTATVNIVLDIAAAGGGQQ